MLYIPFPFKICSQCGLWLLPSLYFFSRQTGQKSGLRSCCKRCHNTANRAYRRANIDKAREGEKRYREANREKERLRHLRQRQSDPEATRAEGRRRYHANAATYRAKYRDNPNQKREAARQWKRDNPEKVHIQGQRHKARKKSLLCDFTQQDWKSALEYFGGKCAYCGRPPGFWHKIVRDHFVPESKGGPFTARNIVPACHDKKGGEGGCNDSKAARDPVEWLTEKFGKRKAKQILKRIHEYFGSLK